MVKPFSYRTPQHLLVLQVVDRKEEARRVAGLRVVDLGLVMKPVALLADHAMVARKGVGLRGVGRGLAMKLVALLVDHVMVAQRVVGQKGVGQRDAGRVRVENDPKDAGREKMVVGLHHRVDRAKNVPALVRVVRKFDVPSDPVHPLQNCSNR
ncbi:hypothetical protein A6X21_02865 [Planctopirus hydrillae]|uniref:Uncharacterized protein n=1 Tax=Planctopirus hydrillae TaxID=1841610 RepID=A0A1C3EN54_9PLAN|nr:hypothetical protein A6X21_02865 [Planctopirus hydrillae]